MVDEKGGKGVCLVVKEVCCVIVKPTAEAVDILWFVFFDDERGDEAALVLLDEGKGMLWIPLEETGVVSEKESSIRVFPRLCESAVESSSVSSVGFIASVKTVGKFISEEFGVFFC